MGFFGNLFEGLAKTVAVTAMFVVTVATTCAIAVWPVTAAGVLSVGAGLLKSGARPRITRELLHRKF